MSSAEIMKRLEANGFTRAIAGEGDFNTAVAAVAEMAASRKGLIVSGEYGVGKTCLVKAVAKMLASRPRFVDLADPDAGEVLTREWMEYMATDLYRMNVILDDLGAEKPVSDFGVRFERAGDFITGYHTRGTGRLLITTNLTTAEIDQRYGGRTFSRLKDLCVPFRLNGKDKREWTKIGGAK